MNEINVTMSIDENAIESLTNQVALNIDIDDQIETWVDNNLDVDDLISDWMSENFELGAYLSDVDLNEYIDVEDLDVESAARDLLNSYSPTNSCRTGDAFTEAVLKAMRYIILDDENVSYIVRAIERFNRHQMKKDVREELRNEMIDELREEVRNDVYAKCLEDFQSQLANMTEPQRESFIRNTINTYQKPIVPTNPHVNYGY